MKTNDLYNILKEENIHYINAKLFLTRGAIAYYKGITAIVLNCSYLAME